MKTFLQHQPLARLRSFPLVTPLNFTPLNMDCPSIMPLPDYQSTSRCHPPSAKHRKLHLGTDPRHLTHHLTTQFSLRGKIQTQRTGTYHQNHQRCEIAYFLEPSSLEDTWPTATARFHRGQKRNSLILLAKKGKRPTGNHHRGDVNHWLF